MHATVSQPMKLTATEFSLLHMLMNSPGRVLTRKFLLERIWGYASDISTRTVDVYIRRLRRKIDEGATTKLLHTIRGSGYLFEG